MDPCYSLWNTVQNNSQEKNLFWFTKFCSTDLFLPYPPDLNTFFSTDAKPDH